MKKSFKLLLLPALLLVALLISISHFSKRTAPSFPSEANTAKIVERNAVPPSKTTASAPPATPFQSFNWKVGAEATYQIEASTRLAGSPDTINESQPTRLGGTLQFVVLGMDSDRVTVAMALNYAYYVTGGERVSRVETFLNATPAVLTLTPEGKLLTLAFDKALPDDDRNLLRLAYGWEFVARPEAVYQETEVVPGAAQTIHSTYLRTNSTDVLKKRFLPVTGDQGGTYQAVANSDFSATIGRVWLSRLEGFEDSMLYFNDRLFAVSRVSIYLKKIGDRPLAPHLSVLISNPSLRVAFTDSPGTNGPLESVAQAVRREALASQWANVPFEEVLKPLASAAEGAVQHAIKPLQDFEDWLSVHSEDGPVQVLNMLQTVEMSSDLAGLLVQGLAQSETPAAREALASILATPEAYSATAVVQATVSAGGVASPDDTLKAQLRHLMNSPASDDVYNLSDTALFSFAGAAKGDNASLKVLLERVSGWLDAGADPANTTKALEALANAAVEDTRIIERATALAKSDDADIRLAAGNFLGTVQGAESPVLSEQLNDPDERVRTQAEQLRSR